MISPLIETLLAQAAKLGDTPAIIEERRSISFAALLLRTRRWAARLKTKGVGNGDTVLVFVTPGIELYALLLAIWWRGAIAVFADAWTTRHRLAQVIQRTQPALFVGVPRARALALLVPELRRVPAISTWFLTRLPDVKMASEPVSVDADQTALVTFTTGSTGEPKGADRSHRFLMTQHHTLLKALGEIPPGPELVTLPVFLLHALASGRTSLLAPIPHSQPGQHDPRRLLQFIHRHKPASVAASPAVYQRLTDFMKRRGYQYAAPIHLHIGGALVMPENMAALRQAFPNARLTAVYGSTEAEPIALIDGDELAALNSDDCLNGVPVGKLFPGARVQIIPINAGIGPTCSEANWQALCQPLGVAGEICVTGPHVVRRYFRQPEATQGTKIQVADTTWHRTGDAGCLDTDGGLRIMGPVSHSFEANGERWYGFPLALQLESLPGAARAAVVVTDRGPVYCVEPESGADCTRLSAILYGLDLPSCDQLWFGPIPRDPRHNSKVDYGRLEQLLRTGL